jgi:putative endonuclease
VKPYQSSFVYIVASRSRNLYTGVTSDLEHRVLEHKNGLVRGFTKRYRIHKLVYFEHFGDIREAIAREKQVKAWTRAKRVALIEATNPTWADLFESTGRTREKQIPRSKERPSG